MQFYYNSGIPQRQRRTRDNRPAVNKDVPTFLVYPDGSHSLGVISPAGGRQDEDPDAAAEQSSAISGAFVVWADPVPSLVVESHEQMKWLRYAFYVVLVVNLAVCSLILADSLKAPSGANGALSPPPSQLPVATFSCATGFKLLGAVGVMRNNIRYLTFYIAAILVLTILSLLWTWSVPHLVTLVLEALLVTVGFKARDSLMGSWFSAHRQ